MPLTNIIELNRVLRELNALAKKLSEIGIQPTGLDDRITLVQFHIGLTNHELKHSQFALILRRVVAVVTSK